MRNVFHRLLGDRGERAAVQFLRRQGMKILGRQVRNLYGEIDIIARDGDCVVFVEVKTRKTPDAGQPFEAVDRQKQRKLTQVALAWLKRQRRLEFPARFDVISIVWPENQSTPDIQHFRNAFEPPGFGQLFS